MLHFIASFVVASAVATAPVFNEYSVAIEPVSSPKLNLSSHPIGRKFRTVISDAVGSGVNFAGHFVIARWGCGTNCSQFAIVDLKTGRILHNPARILTRGLDYRPDSRLLVVNPWASDVTNFPYIPTVYYVFDGHRLRRLQTVSHDG